MKEKLGKALAAGLYGKGTHAESLKIVDGISDDQAKERITEHVHSSWEQLFHIVFWQDLCLKAARLEKVDWPKDGEPSWPAELTTDTWDDLVARFKSGLEEAKTLSLESDLAAPMASWADFPVLSSLIVLAQHNSYHLGQIVVNRLTQGTWPMPKEE
ncbi:MAG: DinB family protein [Candidatus Thorarchaeota archaeon]